MKAGFDFQTALQYGQRLILARSHSRPHSNTVVGLGVPSEGEYEAQSRA
jgi:hypothetical protein